MNEVVVLTGTALMGAAAVFCTLTDRPRTPREWTTTLVPAITMVLAMTSMWLGAADPVPWFGWVLALGGAAGIALIDTRDRLYAAHRSLALVLMLAAHVVMAPPTDASGGSLAPASVGLHAHLQPGVMPALTVIVGVFVVLSIGSVLRHRTARPLHRAGRTTEVGVMSAMTVLMFLPG